MKFRFLGHSGFVIEFGGKNLVIDPFITGNPLSEGKVDLDSINADYILLTHAHGDHVSDVETLAQKTGAKLISNFEVVTYYGSKGIDGHPLNHGGKFNFDFGTVKYVNAVHSSSFPDGSYGGNSGGFVIWNDENCFYFAGDTALTVDMQLIPMTCPDLDVAILPIGDNFTMGYEDAAIASDFVECDKVIGCHFNTFGYIEIDLEKAKSHFKEKAKELIIIDINDEIEI